MGAGKSGAEEKEEEVNGIAHLGQSAGDYAGAAAGEATTNVAGD